MVQIVQIKSYALTSKQNKAHIYVGTEIGAITIKSNLPRWGEALPPPPVQSFLLPEVQLLHQFLIDVTVSKFANFCSMALQKKKGVIVKLLNTLFLRLVTIRIFLLVGDNIAAPSPAH